MYIAKEIPDKVPQHIGLVGYGVSNQAMCRYLMSRGVFPTVRNEKEVSVPSGVTLVTEDYLNTTEDVIFRSPVIRPDLIKGGGIVTSECAYALEMLKGTKIAVTGSDGKTTTSTLIYKMLLEEGRRATLCGNIGTPIIECAPNSSPDTYTVCELSSFQLLDMTPHLDTAVITNITENHLDWHTDMCEYVEAKKNILKHAAHLVLNYDDEQVRALARGAHVTYFSVQDLSHTRPHAGHIVYVRDGTIYYDDVPVLSSSEIRIGGTFNVANFACAIAAIYPSVSHDAIIRVARTFDGVDSRMKCIKKVGGVSFIDSSIDSTPSRTIATLTAFENEKAIVIMGGYDKHLSYAPLSRALKDIKRVILCGENAQKIYDAIKDVTTPTLATTLSEAVKVAYSEAASGDSVILSPASASFDMFKNYKERAKCFKAAVDALTD